MELDDIQLEAEADEGLNETEADGESEAGAKGHISAVLVLAGKQHFVRVGYDVDVQTSSIDQFDTDNAFEVNQLALAYLHTDQGSEPASIRFGTPYLDGASARLKFKSSRKTKGISFKKRRRKNSSKTTRGYKSYTVRFTVEELSVPELGSESIGRTAALQAGSE